MISQVLNERSAMTYPLMSENIQRWLSESVPLCHGSPGAQLSFGPDGQ